MVKNLKLNKSKKFQKVSFVWFDFWARVEMTMELPNMIKSLIKILTSNWSEEKTQN